MGSLPSWDVFIVGAALSHIYVLRGWTKVSFVHPRLYEKTSTLFKQTQLLCRDFAQGTALVALECEQHLLDFAHEA